MTSDSRPGQAADPRSTSVTPRRLALLAAALAAALGTLGAGARKTGDDPARPWLLDVTAESGIDFVHDPGVGGEYFIPESIGSGAALLDYDGDGDLDLYLLNGAPRRAAEADEPAPRNRLYRREGDGRYLDVTDRSGLGDAGYGMGAAVGDVDGDGELDVFVSNFGPDALYRNRGDGSFEEATAAAGLGSAAWGTSALFFDPDADGDLDLFVTTYLDFDPAVVCSDDAGRRDYCGPDGGAAVPDLLYRNDGGRFTDVSAASGIGRRPGKGLGAASADFDGDSRPDLYVANDGEPNCLWINAGDGTFEDRALPMGAAVNELGRAEAGMGVALGDADGDGLPDLLVTHLGGETNTFYRGSRLAGFEDASSAAGLAGASLPYTGFGAGFLDIDNDGDLDLATVNGRVTRGPLLTPRRPPTYWDPYAEPNQLWLNDGRGRFTDASRRTGTFHSLPENSRALALGDLDNDGDVDLLVTHGGGPARLFHNQRDAPGAWLTLQAAGAGLGSQAVGARIEVDAGGSRILRLLAPGYSFLASNDPRVHVGLPADRVQRVTFGWPGGRIQEIRDPPVRRIVVVRPPPRAGREP